MSYAHYLDLWSCPFRRGKRSMNHNSSPFRKSVIFVYIYIYKVNIQTIPFLKMKDLRWICQTYHQMSILQHPAPTPLIAMIRLGELHLRCTSQRKWWSKQSREWPIWIWDTSFCVNREIWTNFRTQPICNDFYSAVVISITIIFYYIEWLYYYYRSNLECVSKKSTRAICICTPMNCEWQKTRHNLYGSSYNLFLFYVESSSYMRKWLIMKLK